MLKKLDFPFLLLNQLKPCTTNLISGIGSGVFEQKLTNSAYLLNETLSAVDVAAISGLGYYSLRFGHNWQQEYPKLRQWFELLHQRKSIDCTMPKA